MKTSTTKTEPHTIPQENGLTQHDCYCVTRHPCLLENKAHADTSHADKNTSKTRRHRQVKRVSAQELCNGK